MTGVFGAAGLEVYYSRRFMDDVRRLTPPLVTKVEDSVRLLQQQGQYYPRFETRKVAGNPNPDYRFLDIDNQYRMVAVIQGRHILLEKVGNHDETLKWGAAATLREYEERISAADVELGGRGKRKEAATDVLFDTGLSVAEIVTSPVLTELITIADERVLEGWANGTIEDWMIFLSPIQRRAVDRAVSGPGRVTGGPGTGKTVVALHRAEQFARQVTGDQRVLLTSFVNTVPAVLSGLFERLAPDVVDRIECRTVHSLAKERVDLRGPHAPLDQNQQARARFNRVFESNPQRVQQLRIGARLTADYVYEEITRVIEGRGIPELTAYLAVSRYGRKRQLAALLRRLIWSIYEEYLAALANPLEPVMSWDQLLSAGVEAVKERPGQQYAAIVVDEAQDITEVGMRFLVELLENGPAGRILVVGDAGQRIYHGGWRLADLGLEIRGRSFALSVCYRSTDEIMKAVGALGQTLSTEEFGEDGLRSLATSTVRSGPRPELRRFRSEDEEIAWILGQLDPDDPRIDGTAILAYARRSVDSWCDRLASAGLGAVRLEDYRGRPKPGVKVGTFHRAKGLEFERVFIPGLNDAFPYGDRNDDDILTQGSALYVAMSRARDRLLMSHTGAPSMFLEKVAPLCETETAER